LILTTVYMVGNIVQQNIV